MITINTWKGYILFESVVMHSFVSCKFTNKLNTPVREVVKWLVISTPLREEVEI